MKLMPSYYMTHSLQQVMMKGQALGSVLFDIAVLALTALVTLSIASWRLRKQFVTAA